MPGTHTITAASAAIGVEKTKIYRLMRDDEDFAKAVEEAMFNSRWAWLDEGHRRAVEGVTKPVVSGGKVVYITDPRNNTQVPLTVKEYSDGVLMQLLRGGFPERFKTNVAAELSGPGGRPIPLQPVRPIAQALDLSKLSDAELDELERLMGKASPQLALPAPTTNGHEGDEG